MDLRLKFFVRLVFLDFEIYLLFYSSLFPIVMAWAKLMFWKTDRMQVQSPA